MDGGDGVAGAGGAEAAARGEWAEPLAVMLIDVDGGDVSASGELLLWRPEGIGEDDERDDDDRQQIKVGPGYRASQLRHFSRLAEAAGPLVVVAAWAALAEAAAVVPESAR